MKANELIEKVMNGEQPAKLLEADDLMDKIDKISTKYTRDLAGFIHALSQSRDAHANPKLKAALEAAAKAARECDQQIGKALVLAAGGQYD